MSAGTYTVTITSNDWSPCSITETYTISNSNGTFNLDSTIVMNESCGQGDGSIDVYVSGGTGPYSYTWNTGGTTSSLSSLSEGNYYVDIYDASGCFLTDTIDLLNTTNGMGNFLCFYH